MYNRIDYHKNTRLCNRIYNRTCNRTSLKFFFYNRNRICNRLIKNFKKYDYVVDYFYTLLIKIIQKKFQN